MNRTDLLKSFEGAFGTTGTCDGLHWDALTFTDPRPNMPMKYVGWVDVMGASHMMQRAADAASKSIGQLHEAILKAVVGYSRNANISLHPLSDGVYVVAPDYGTVAAILARVFRSYARSYLEVTSDSRDCLIRAAIAYGQTVDMEFLRPRLARSLPDSGLQERLNSYFANILHGNAFVAAHEAERKAPPFGIYHDESLRMFGCTNSGLPVAWPLEKWWCNGRKPNEKQRNFAELFGKRLLAHFSWLEKHPMESGMDEDGADNKIDGYNRKIKEYFGLPDTL